MSIQGSVVVCIKCRQTARRAANFVPLILTVFNRQLLIVHFGQTIKSAPLTNGSIANHSPIV